MLLHYGDNDEEQLWYQTPHFLSGDTQFLNHGFLQHDFKPLHNISEYVEGSTLTLKPR